ncbi:dihydrolipoamide acetyltransferase family protein [Sanguibacter sp. A247]|uniref:dihydrolipoamide acetyltransferase family protein n=1 Tax=unclassified Sanguibacter TaxID=2645534 RepID=UPI003FD78364
MPTFESFPLPDAGEGLTEAEIVQWLVAVGDEVTVNQTIVEIETAKSLVELPSPWTGVVAEILAPEGTTVDVGTPIIVIDTDPGGVAVPAAVSGTAASSAPAVAAAEPGDADSGSGAVLVGYGTAEHAPTRRPRRAQPTATSSAAAPSRASAAPAAPSSPAPSRASAAPADASAPARPATPAPAPSASSPASASSASGVRVKPPVRKLARDLGVDLTSIVPTGPGGLVTREDVLGQAERIDPRTLATYPNDDDNPWLAQGAVTSDGRQTRVPVRSVRKRTAEAMVASAFSAPHVTVFHTVDVTRTMRLVERLRADRDFAEVRVTPLLVAMKALLIAIDRHPEINASWDEAAQEIVYKHYVNLGIAAATPRGLMVPNIKDAHRATLLQLAQALGGLTALARTGKTPLADMVDGTITITNVGVFGIDTGTPILNPGEAAILAFGAIREQPWVHKGKIKKRWVTQLALSVDHRLVDGELASRVLADVAAVLHEPGQALVWV